MKFLLQSRAHVSVVTKAAKRHNALCDSATLSNTHTQSSNASHTHTHSRSISSLTPEVDVLHHQIRV